MVPVRLLGVFGKLPRGMCGNDNWLHSIRSRGPKAFSLSTFLSALFNGTLDYERSLEAIRRVLAAVCRHVFSICASTVARGRSLNPYSFTFGCARGVATIF